MMVISKISKILATLNKYLFSKIRLKRFVSDSTETAYNITHSPTGDHAIIRNKTIVSSSQVATTDSCQFLKVAHDSVHTQGYNHRTIQQQQQFISAELESWNPLIINFDKIQFVAIQT